MSECVLITGGAGFIGSKLAAAHAAAGDEVHIIVRPRGHISSNRTARGVDVARVHLEDVEALSDYLSKVRPTIIYHLASCTGRGPGMVHPLDLRGLTGDLHNFLALLTAARTAAPKVLVRSGSLAEYGNGVTPARESQREQPLSTYTTAMVAGAHFAALLQPTLPFPVLTARLALTYGEDQSDTFLLPRLIQRCLAGVACDVAHPNRRRDLIHVDDVVEGLRTLARSDLPGGSIVNLCTGIAPTMGEVAERILDLTGADPALITVGNDTETGTEISTVLGSPDLALALMGWSARIPLEEGLARTIAGAKQRVYA
ncbi:NAD(P)-dependent oxidoreductase [Sphingomonas sp. JC676]|uniref:NAD-dependent epimerase/dehydratase family protein n=1 Tax=Sphingomonas sp. JC676 TaxID=2768065 RepID=UPI001657CEE8|nr:NAD(P)-dependent oxidoreductase [Sphingomonas sp. JC676]MBC9031391.1 NAD(P)-dependent oxidoreductase [Sphingomonas sp. JC676]